MDPSDLAKLRPYGDCVIVEVEPDVFKTPTGLLMAHANIERNEVLTGRVLAVGPGPRRKNGSRRKMDFEVGDRVAFSRSACWAQLPRKAVEQREVLILREEQLLETGFVLETDAHVECKRAATGVR